MKLKTNLIMLEGIPGSGKSTFANKIHKHIINHNRKASLFLEGDIHHPVDLFWCAYLNKPEFEQLLIDYNNESDNIISNSIIETNYSLTRYRNKDGAIFSDELTDYLAEREFCYGDKPIVPFNVFTEVFRKRFERFTKQALDSNKITIFDGTFLQHQLHDIKRNYTVESGDVINHQAVLYNEIKKLNPILLYISQSNLKESLRRTAHIRCKPKYNTQEAFKYWGDRKELELQILNQLPIESYIIDNSDFDWDRVYDKIIDILSEHI